MVDVCADGGWLFTTLNCMNILQMVIQVCTTIITIPPKPQEKDEFCFLYNTTCIITDDFH